jgi:hypothetical protein
MRAPIFAPNVAKKTTKKTFISLPAAALYAAGGTTTSDGKGINELSIAINIVIVQ